MQIMSSYAHTPTNLVFSPDGQVLCYGRSDQRLVFWETATGREIGLVKGYQGDITSLAFSPNGKQLASGGSDTTALIWDLSKILSPPESAVRKLSEEETQARWADLVGSDAAKAYRAIRHLSESPDLTVEFLKKHLRPAQSVKAERLDKLIAELDDKQFSVRQNASAELERLGELAVPSARKALQGKVPAETRRRLEQLLAAVEGKGSVSGDRLLTLRAVEVLERIGNTKAQELLRSLAHGAAGSLQTEEANEALKRLAQKEIPRDQGK